MKNIDKLVMPMQVTTDWYELMRQVQVQMNDTLEDVINKAALNTTKKYMIYRHETIENKIYLKFDLFDRDDELIKGYMIDMDEVREYLRRGDK